MIHGRYPYVQGLLRVRAPFPHASGLHGPYLILCRVTMIYLGCGPTPSHSMYMGTVYEKVSGR